jgi:dienelactone hydrolase
MATDYDPFVPGRFRVDVRTVEARDAARDRLFPCEIWTPAAEGKVPLILYSHPSGGERRAATYLCTHLSSHGYVVAVLNHSEIVAPELARKEGETPEQKSTRIEAAMANRVPDIRFLLDFMIEASNGAVGLAGHSFGGWTVLATPDVEPRIRAIVALAPGGASQRKPGILPVTLDFHWGRDVPTLYLVGEDDISLPLAGMVELFERTPATKQMVIPRRADHLHFMDNVEAMHEAVRAMAFPRELA